MLALSSDQIVVIFLSLGVLLAVARLLGELFRAFNQPSVVGELLAGILLGPTVLGRFAPIAMDTLFPVNSDVAVVMEGVTKIGIALFLLLAGMEVDLSTIFRLGRAALGVSAGGIIVPFAVGLVTAWLVPGLLDRPPGVDALVFNLFFATALSISALPVIAKTLMDLRLFRTDMGMVVISAAVFDDLTGWIIFAVILGLMGHGGEHAFSIPVTVALVLGFAVFMLTLGRWLIHRAIGFVQAHASWPGGILGFAIALAMFGAAFTQWIGVHAIFGAFFVGVAFGDSSHLRQHTRTILEQFVSFVFAPLFFASIGLRTDFVQNFDIRLCTIVLLIACLGKLLGCTLGARLGGMSQRESLAVAFGMNARGAMGTILGLLALQAGVINEKMFVALVVMALATSMMSGPAMQRILHLRRPRRLADLLAQRNFAGWLKSADRREAVRELSLAVSAANGLNSDVIDAAVWAREEMMATGMGNLVAIPHARIEGLKTPLVAVGLSQRGIDFDAPDGEPAKLLFMILTPKDDQGAQLEILAEISRTFGDDENRQRALRATGFTEFLGVVKTAVV